MASFTNLTLSAASLATKYLNEWKTVAREVRDPMTDTVSVAADYSNLGHLLIAVTLIGVIVPILTVAIIQSMPWKTKS
jgi:F0F1-type ATP synthase assembly protein I